MITLHTCATGNGYRASIMLEELGLPYAVEVVDFATGGHRAPAFLDISPVGKVPLLVDADAGVTVAETLAICLYLADKTGRLLPDTRAERALAHQWASIIVSDFQAALPGVFFARLLGAEDHAKIIAKYFDDVQRYLAAMDQALSRTRYLSGPVYSYADVLAAPLVLSTLPRFEIDLTPFPSILRWRDEIAQRPAVIKGMAVPG